jgi:type VI secretion system protein VasJ
VLGLGGDTQYWQWAAYGKHPVARDYFRVGSDAPLIKAFFGWVEKGYQLLRAKQNPASQPYAWRFWAKGAKKDNFICGVGRDSSDSIGRPYPLLIMGTGPLEKWEDYWDLLPLACEKTWSQIEYLSTRRFTDFKQLEGEVRIIKPPSSRWSEFNDQRARLSASGSSFHGGPAPHSSEVEEKISRLSNKAEFLVPLEHGPSGDAFGLAILWHSLLKARLSGTPNAIFMGGVPERTYLAVFKRSLIPADFVRLWSAFSTGVMENQTLVGGPAG